MIWSIKHSGEVLSKLKDRGFQSTSLSTYDFSTLYTTLPTYEGVSKSSCTNAITFKWYKIPYQTYFHVLYRYVSSSGAKFQQVASKYNKFMKL